MLIFDAHLDLSLNAIEFNRDLRRPLEDIRASEVGLNDHKARATNTVTFGEIRKGGIGVCVATQLAGCMKPRASVAVWESPEQAWAMTQGQLAWYRAMEDVGEMKMLRTSRDLSNHLDAWNADPVNTALGYILSLEGADSMRTLADLETAWDYGLRAMGPAHYGIGRYALGHDQEGPLSDKGKELIKEMDRLGMILDVTHLCEQTFWDGLDIFQGPVWASHHNCRALVDDPRQLSDDQIKAVAERGGVLGLAFDAWMIVPGWVRGETTPESAGVTIAHAVDHVDHICQLLGNAQHVGIGTDLDGGFGTEQSPQDLNSIADITRVFEILQERGYSESDINSIAHGNFIQCALNALPA
jgi:membrane dipeptidase